MTGLIKTKSEKISVLLPNYNYSEFISERLESILSQTHTNLEVIVVDSYSNDGAWEIIKDYSNKDKRITCTQAPRGMYEAWNRCLSMVSGDFVYIATSDDTMRIDSFERMLEALNEFPHCGVCDSKLKIIDINGTEIEYYDEKIPIYNYLGRNRDAFHIRNWPHDFLLYFSGAPVFTSMTQVLIRSEVVRKIGEFSTKWGTKSDFEWGMKVCGQTSTVYVPEKLATWRIHEAQATSSRCNEQNRNRHNWNFQMARSALAYTLNNSGNLTEQLMDDFIEEYLFLKTLSHADLLKNDSLIENTKNLLILSLIHPKVIAYVLKSRAIGLTSKKHSNPGTIGMRKLDRKYNLSKYIDKRS